MKSVGVILLQPLAQRRYSSSLHSPLKPQSFPKNFPHVRLKPGNPGKQSPERIAKSQLYLTPG